MLNIIIKGVFESIIDHALAGGVFCLLGGQPLVILSSSGPILIFELTLVEICSNHGIYYLTFRCWIGLWCAMLCIVIVAANGSFIVRLEEVSSIILLFSCFLF